MVTLSEVHFLDTHAERPYLTDCTRTSRRVVRMAMIPVLLVPCRGGVSKKPVYLISLEIG